MFLKLHFLTQQNFMLYVLVNDRLPETRVLGFGSAVEKWVEGKLNNAFPHFLPNF